MSDVADRIRALTRELESSVFWSLPASPAQVFESLAERAERGGVEHDRYGEDGAVAELEARVAELLGKPAAVLFPSGIMAQQCALRVWCDRSGSRRVAIPDLSHLLLHEADGPRRLHGFEFEHLTTGREAPTAAALAAVSGSLGAALVELPLRDAGCLLPTWEELAGLSAAARARGVPLHADGARIWEAQPFYGRPLAEIADLLDSVYVSLYKGLGAPSGALVAGDPDLAAQLRLWRTRMGGTLFSLTTPAVGGLLGLEERLPLMGEQHAWALRLAAALTERGLRTFPDPPHIATFLVYAEGSAAAVNERLLAWMREHRLALGGPWRPAETPGWVLTELACSGASLAHDPGVVAGWLADVVRPGPAESGA